MFYVLVVCLCGCVLFFSVFMLLWFDVLFVCVVCVFVCVWHSLRLMCCVLD